MEIDSNATAEDAYYYKGIIKLEKNTLESKRNNVALSYGKQGEARIIYEETTYLRYFLEQIGINIK